MRYSQGVPPSEAAAIMEPEALQTPLRPTPRIPRLQLADEQPQPWTPARCQRLLRPLQSRIASLRKATNLAGAGQFKSPSLVNAAVDCATVAGALKRRGFPTEELVSRKKVRHTYSQKPKQLRTFSTKIGTCTGSVTSSRASKIQRALATSADIVVSTPILRRARGHLANSPREKTQCGRMENFLRSGSSSAAIVRTRRSSGLLRSGENLAVLRDGLTSPQYEDYEGICRGFEVLIRATLPDMPASSAPRSLISMCARKIPCYIKELELWDKADRERDGTLSTIDHTNISNEIYHELEDFGAADVGWKHLRTVVRAHGAALLSEAISEGLVDDRVCSLLVDLCTKLEAGDLAESLLSAFVWRQFPAPKMLDSDFEEDSVLKPLDMLLRYSSRKDRDLFLLRTLSRLFLGRLLPAYWLVTRGTRHAWASIFRLIARGEVAGTVVDCAIDFLWVLAQECPSTCTKRSASTAVEGEFDMACQQTLISALSILVSMVAPTVTERRSPSEPIRETKCSLVGKVVARILGASMQKLCHASRSTPSLSVHLIQLANFLSSSSLMEEPATSTLAGSFASIWANLDCGSERLKRNARRHYDAIISLLASVAACRARGSDELPHVHLQNLWDRLRLLKLPGVTMRNIIEVSALSLAQRTNNLADFVYAETVDLQDPRQEYLGRRPGVGRETHFAGYRWEDTIGEWITVTPAATKRDRRGPSLLQISNNECNGGKVLPLGVNTNASVSPAICLEGGSGLAARNGRPERHGSSDISAFREAEKAASSAVNDKKRPSKTTHTANRARDAMSLNDELSLQKENRPISGNYGNKCISRKRPRTSFQKPLAIRDCKGRSEAESDDELGL